MQFENKTKHHSLFLRIRLIGLVSCDFCMSNKCEKVNFQICTFRIVSYNLCYFSYLKGICLLASSHVCVKISPASHLNKFILNISYICFEIGHEFFFYKLFSIEIFHLFTVFYHFIFRF